MASRIHGCLPYQHFPRNLLFFCIFAIRDGHPYYQPFSRAMTSENTHHENDTLSMEDNDRPLPPHERYGHTKEKVLKFRDGTRKFTWNGLEIRHIGRYGGLKWQKLV